MAVIPSSEATGFSGWQATNALGLSTQLSPVSVLATTLGSPSPMKGVRFLDRSARRGRRDARLNDLEVTILEALEVWHSHVELTAQDALDRFVKLMETDRVRVDALVHASITEPASVRERLRVVLLHGSWTEEAARITRAVDPRTRKRALALLGEAKDVRAS